MKKVAYAIFFFVAMVILPAGLVKDGAARDDERQLLADIAADIGRYRNKSVSLRLRLKYEDRVFGKIVFYDRKNTDIMFDIAQAGTDEKYEKMRLNLHAGMEYLVTFTVRDVGTLGQVIGDLEEFTSFALRQLS